jgi:phosphoribosylformylglycinamidine synthase
MVDGKRIMIPYTLLISAMGVMENASKTTTASFKKAGNAVYVIGQTKDELGCSEYFRMKGRADGILPKVDAAVAKKTFDALQKAIAGGLVAACHDISDGGLALAAAEMCFGNKLGVSIDLNKVPYSGEKSDAFVLFSESASRFVVEIAADKKAAFEAAMNGVVLAEIGSVTNDGSFRAKGFGGATTGVLISECKEIWRTAFEKKL